MNLKISKPIAFFDLETTGLNIGKDRIVEISILKYFPDAKTEIKTWRINPEIPIPIESTNIHGITDDDIKDSPTFNEVAKEILTFIGNSDLAGYNSNKFDVPLLVEEFARVDIDFDFRKRNFIDVQNIFHKMEPRNLAAAYRFYCTKEIQNAHSAEADVMATFEVFRAQMEKYSDLPNNTEGLEKFSAAGNFADLVGRIAFNDQGEEVVNFGKHKGKKVTDVFKEEPSYYHWIMHGDFPSSTKKVFTEIFIRNKQK